MAVSPQGYTLAGEIVLANGVRIAVDSGSLTDIRTRHSTFKADPSANVGKCYDGPGVDKGTTLVAGGYSASMHFCISEVSAILPYA